MAGSYLWLTSLILCIIYVKFSESTNPGPLVIATKGAVWPKPQEQNVSESYFVLVPTQFQFELSPDSNNCNFLQDAFQRYGKIIQQNTNLVLKQLKHRNHQKNKKKWLLDDDFISYLNVLTVNLTGDCDDNEYPSIDIDEQYHLWVTEPKILLQASTIWGILRGLETFSQLIYLGSDGLSLRINSSEIIDYPRYKHRGLLIDTSRHYLPLDKIYKTIDAMSYNKFNVLHWHIVDDPSFPYVSLKFPKLSQYGAFNPYTNVYTPEDIQDVIEYSRLRGVRVMSEFDTPGHTRSWGVGYPEILTACEEAGQYGPLDPSKDETYSFVNSLFEEVKDLFKDEFLHLGGDEVDFTCWKSNQGITDFMKEKNITSYQDLESYYIQNIVDLTDQLNFTSIVWEDVFNNGVKLPKETLVHVWRGGWTTTINSVTEAGQKALLSSCWYLDGLSSGGDWEDFYLCDPTDFNGTEAQQKLVLGGEACMWGEVVNEYNVISRVWPRASAVAEKLWSAYDASNLASDDASKRIEEHTCRMNRRGIGAQPPNGAGYCD